MNGPPPLPRQLSYEARLHHFEKTREFTLRGNTLVSKQDGHERIIPLSEIQSIRCRFFPTRYQFNRYEMMLTLANGLKIKIGNQLYRGLADFEDRSDQFRDFVKALHEARMRVSPACRFYSGITPASFWLTGLFLAVVLIVLAVLVVVMFATIPIVAVIKLVIFIFMIPVAIRWFRKNRPAVYHGDTIPPDVIP